MEKKKSSLSYIIPPEYVKGNQETRKTATKANIDAPEIPNPQPEKSIEPSEAQDDKKLVDKNDVNLKEVSEQKISSPRTNNRSGRTSGLSLNSIRKKKEHEEKKIVKVVDPNNLPKSAFTEDQLRSAWVEYGKMLDKKGERILGSMFAMNIPSLAENAEILLELPNNSMKADMEAAEAALLQFLYKKLDNYFINLKIAVNEEASKKYAFTPQDKYEKLKEKNPLIDKLRSSFDLDF